MNLLGTFLIALLLIAAGVAAMAIGVICRRPCLRGSCGGPAATAPGGERLSCASCPNRRQPASEE